MYTQLSGVLDHNLERYFKSLYDTPLLQLTGLGIVPFFVENVSVLQLSALRLVRSVGHSKSQIN